MVEFQSWRSYRNFERAVRRDFRYVRSVENEKFLSTVLETAATRKLTLEEQLIFWRAQLGHDWRKEDYDGEVFEVECGYSPRTHEAYSGPGI